jgi:ABC-type multidrug transport system ATPase subunit
MDPAARRSMWKLISSTMEGRCVILTTHSMEECEALCGRIAIMAQGRLKCIGSASHLKLRYGSGYQMTINVDKAEHQNVGNFMSAALTGVSLDFSDAHSISFRIPKGTVSLGNIFRLVENLKSQGCPLTEYSISETTLEQIFLSFAEQEKRK